MRLCIVRHGQAESGSEGGDFARTLTARGKRELESMAIWLRERACAPQLILHSPLVRTSQTAALLQRGLGTGELLMSECLKPGASLDGVLGELAGLGTFESVMLVGHAPDVSMWSYRLIAHEPEQQLRFEPGTVAGFNFSGSVGARAGRLQYFCAPSDIGGF